MLPAWPLCGWSKSFGRTGCGLHDGHRHFDVLRRACMHFAVHNHQLMMMLLPRTATASSMQGAVSDVLSDRLIPCLSLGDPLATAFPICLSLSVSLFPCLPRLAMSCSLPYGSRGDVKSHDSHPAFIPAPCLVRTFRSRMLVCLPYAIMPCHAMPCPTPILCHC